MPSLTRGLQLDRQRKGPALDNTFPCNLDQARAAKSKALAAFENLAPVVGVGITRVGDGYGVKVNLEVRPPEGVVLPKAIDGVPIQVEVVGPLRKA